VVLCTDGVFEALDQNGDAFGWERLRQAVAAPSAGAVDLHARLTAALDRHVDDEPVSDDRTLVVFERRAGAG
jgi:serine phosphatase RsbU (regulator of sigma subunit)